MYGLQRERAIKFRMIKSLCALCAEVLKITTFYDGSIKFSHSLAGSLVLQTIGQSSTQRRGTNDRKVKLSVLQGP